MFGLNWHGTGSGSGLPAITGPVSIIAFSWDAPRMVIPVGPIPLPCHHVSHSVQESLSHTCVPLSV
jgi:hypothetical protein